MTYGVRRSRFAFSRGEGGRAKRGRMWNAGNYLKCRETDVRSQALRILQYLWHHKIRFLVPVTGLDLINEWLGRALASSAHPRCI